MKNKNQRTVCNVIGFIYLILLSFVIMNSHSLSTFDKQCGAFGLKTVLLLGCSIWVPLFHNNIQVDIYIIHAFHMFCESNGLNEGWNVMNTI